MNPSNRLCFINAIIAELILLKISVTSYYYHHIQRKLDYLVDSFFFFIWRKARMDSILLKFIKKNIIIITNKRTFDEHKCKVQSIYGFPIVEWCFVFVVFRCTRLDCLMVFFLCLCCHLMNGMIHFQVNKSIQTNQTQFQ